MKPFILGLLIGVFVVVPAAAYLFVGMGFVSLATTAKPLPLEATFARKALHTSIGTARDLKSPIQPTDENLMAGAKAYRENCALCHGLPGQQRSLIAEGMFPDPPQLLEGRDMVTDDPEGSTFWKISHGIRLSGMPRFDSLSENQRWQLALLLKQADKLPAAVQANLRQPIQGTN
jgi:thiosulfate dehydrogenase